MLERIYKAQNLMHSTCQQFGREINIMQISSAHTLAVFRNGIKFSLPQGVKLLSGPGCPACVVDQRFIDAASYLADSPDCIIATYPDMLQMPCEYGTLESKRLNGNINLVDGAEQALQLAKANPDKTVVFIAVGFETKLVSTAAAIKQASDEGIDNFCILNGHKKITAAMKALLSAEELNIDAFLCPANSSQMAGAEAFDEIIDHYNVPCVIAGLEPMNIIEGLAEICRQLKEQKPEPISIDTAIVIEKENALAKAIIEECFEPADGHWLGFGKLEKSAFKLKKVLSNFDAFERFEIAQVQPQTTLSCRCGEILHGLIEPFNCELFENSCTPEHPGGPCMASPQGTCAVWFKYNRKRKK